MPEPRNVDQKTINCYKGIGIISRKSGIEANIGNWLN